MYTHLVTMKSDNGHWIVYDTLVIQYEKINGSIFCVPTKYIDVQARTSKDAKEMVFRNKVMASHVRSIF